MKKLSLIAATVLLASSGAFAQTAVDTFNVNVNFTSSCSVKTAAANLDFTYVAFQPGPATATPTSTVFQCTRGLGATFAFDNPGGDATGSAANAASITGAGVIAGLRYTMAGTASKTTTGTVATAAAAGTADEYTVAITGSMAAGQAGDDSLAATQVRTLTISY
jgi:hypothetical protein